MEVEEVEEVEGGTAASPKRRSAEAAAPFGKRGEGWRGRRLRRESSSAVRLYTWYRCSLVPHMMWRHYSAVARSMVALLALGPTPRTSRDATGSAPRGRGGMEAVATRSGEGKASK